MTLQDFQHRDVNDQASLTEALAWASYQYYVLNEPPMSDYEFDMEFKQLQALEKASGKVLPGSPTQRVGSDIQGGFVKRRHLIPMQSIENVYSDEELQQWVDGTSHQLHAAFPHDVVSYTYEPKYDGLSISLVYEKGRLTDAVTRGNQIEGESVIANVRTIRNVPLELDTEIILGEADDLFAERISLPDYFEVRGEVLMPQGAFDRLNAEKEANGERPFANKRNAASGSLKQLDPKVTARRGLIVNAYAAYSTDEDFQREVMSSQEKTLELLDRLGFSRFLPASIGAQVAYSDIEQLRDAIHAFNDLRTSHQLPYDCDGVVVKVNERRHQEFLGLNTTFPNWCKARKFPQEAQTTLIRDVTFQVGMTGHITPVAELDPTVISGSVVSRATLNNENYIRQLGLTIGSYVYVQKAGEVIPQVIGRGPAPEEADLQEREIVFPANCPCCGTPLTRKGEYWICPNHHCKEQAVQRIEYWCGKDCANIKGLGPEVLSDIYDQLDVASVYDLYRVFVSEENAFEPDIFAPTYRHSIQARLGEGYAEKSVNQMFLAIRESIQTLTLDRIIGGLGIDGVGKITGRILAAHFGTYAAFRAATMEQLVQIDSIGEIMARNILEADYEDFDKLFGYEATGDHAAVDASNDSAASVTDVADDVSNDSTASVTDVAVDASNDSAASVTDVASANAATPLPFNLTYQAAERLGTSLDGLTVIFTGTSYRFKRDEIKTFFTGHGAKYVGSVSGKVNYVITGDAPGQNKLDKARQLGVEVIAERDFYEKFGL